MDAIGVYVTRLNEPLKNLDLLGVLGIFLSLIAVWFKNAEKTGAPCWQPVGWLHQIGLMVRRTANDILLSAFGAGATIFGFFITIVMLAEGQAREWLIFGLTVTQFLVVVGSIGALNLLIRVDDAHPMISWQKKCGPLSSTALYLVIGLSLSWALLH
jgi:hypothetical protein